MEIKINVTSSEEDRKNVELFEFRRRKEEEFKHKIEEQMDSLISQNEKEKLSIKDEIRKLEDEIRKFENKKADGRSYFPNCSYNDEKFNKLEGRYQKEVVKHGA